MTNIINGKKISKNIMKKIKAEIESKGISPGLAVIQIGKRQDSNIYIRKKREACELVGINFSVYNLDNSVSTQDVCELILQLNFNKDIDGIIVQLPIPSHLNEEIIFNNIDYWKDVDGFHSRNIGDLVLEKRNPQFVSCTPMGCLEILREENIKIKGKHVVIIGKSNAVGLPMALLLLKEMATVTICHIDTVNIKEHTKVADIVIVACGKPNMVKKEWLKKGVVIIDIGINIIQDKKGNNKLVGDVDFDDVKEITSAITPVPGGVGPVTVAMILKNTMHGFNLSHPVHSLSCI